jgi:hypothetical protein
MRDLQEAAIGELEVPAAPSQAMDADDENAMSSEEGSVEGDLRRMVTRRQQEPHTGLHQEGKGSHLARKQSERSGKKRNDEQSKRRPKLEGGS